MVRERHGNFHRCIVNRYLETERVKVLQVVCFPFVIYIPPVLSLHYLILSFVDATDAKIGQITAVNPMYKFTITPRIGIKKAARKRL